MSAQPRVYLIVSRVHVNKWDEGLQAVVSGWQIRARWTATTTYLDVFVPDAYYTAANVDAAIRAAGTTDDQIHALGA